MAGTARAVPAPITREEQQYVASQWKLVWWRFRRHRLAMVAAVVIAMFYLASIFAEFLTIHDPFDSDAKRSYLAPQPVHFFDGWQPTRPYVNGLRSARNPATLALDFQVDESVRFPIQFFTSGFEYKVLGMIATDLHIMGVEQLEDPGDHVVAFYPLGTDRFGRDMWSRLMMGTRISMSIGLVGVAVSLILGMLMGGISGYRGGMTDIAIQRLIEFLRSIPTIPLWMTLAAAVPRDWSVVKVYFAITVIISIIGWTTLAREVRGRFLALREEDFVVAARLYGSSQLRVIFRHMMPSFMSHIIATTTLAIPGMIIAETSLSFLGLGLRQPIISYGVLLFEAQNLKSVALAPWLLIPGAFVIVVVLAFNFLGDGLRNAADPYSTSQN